MSKLRWTVVMLSVLWLIPPSGVTWAVSQSGTQVSQGSSVISLVLAAVKDTVKVGSPVLMKVTMRNRSGHQTFYWRENSESPGSFEYRIDVLNDKSNVAPMTEFGRALKTRDDPAYLTADTMPPQSSGGWRTLKAGEAVAEVIDISKLYDLSHAGKYSVKFRRLDEESKTFADSNIVTVTINP
ncbi:MAG: hypothetical protein WAN23_13410 [Candidatus Acidiferrales bacterium]